MENPHKQKIKKIKALVKKMEALYRDDPNIISIGWGLANRGGKVKPEMSLIFHVKEKYSSDKQIQAIGSHAIPCKVEGFATDVRKQLHLVADQSAGSRADKIADPLVGGVDSANLEKINRTFFWYQNGGGTLGILCRDQDNNPMALSNWHVWANDGAKIGDRIIQPRSPEGATYAEGISKVAACGPLLSTVIEGRVPSPISAGLYAGAAAAGILAGATDHKDPIRRGQELTNIDTDTFTHGEELQLDLDFPRVIPWAGQPFPIDVRWRYTRQTNKGDKTVEIKERRVNPQILLGQAIAPDSARYQPGSTITLQAAIWDYQARPQDAYHLTAHLISESNPDYAVRTILHASPCRPIDLAPRYKDRHRQEANPITRDRDITCVNFGHYAPINELPSTESFGPLAVSDSGDKPLTIVYSDTFGSGLHIAKEGLGAQHAPASRIILKLVQTTDQPLEVRAFNRFNYLLTREVTANLPGEEQYVTIQANLISRLEFSGGEGQLLSYCFVLATDEVSTTLIPTQLKDAYNEIEVPFIDEPRDEHATVHRHCFRGQRQLPSDAPTGRYKIYLTTSNINHVPFGTEPTVAARTIGGHELGTQSQGFLCAFMLLGDHEFDIF